MRKNLVHLSCLVLIALVVSSPRAGESMDIVDVSLSKTAPTVELRVVEDTVAGWNVFADVSHFTFASGGEATAPDPRASTCPACRRSPQRPGT